MDKVVKKEILSAAIFPLLMVAVLWMVKIYENIEGLNFIPFGLYPRNLNGLQGIITTVFIHADWKHLFNNSVPLFILGWAMFFFYKEVAWKVFLWVILMGGLWTWISAREASHVGASGLVYGLFSFILFSGFIRRNKQLLSISFLVAFLYGSLVWGLLPIDYTMSWESHFWGFIAGFALALYYRKVGKQAERHEWNEAEERALEEMDFWKNKEPNPDPGFRFVYKKKDEEKPN